MSPHSIPGKAVEYWNHDAVSEDFVLSTKQTSATILTPSRTLSENISVSNGRGGKRSPAAASLLRKQYPNRGLSDTPQPCFLQELSSSLHTPSSSPLSTPLTHTQKTAPLAVAPHFRDSSTHCQQARSLQPNIHPCVRILLQFAN
jgi:hypothetical protein